MPGHRRIFWIDRDTDFKGPVLKKRFFYFSSAALWKIMIRQRDKDECKGSFTQIFLDTKSVQIRNVGP